MPPVQLLQHLTGPFVAQVIGFHDPSGPELKGGGDEDADVGDMVIGEDHIGAPSHDNKIFFLGHLTDEIALVEKNGIALGRP